MPHQFGRIPPKNAPAMQASAFIRPAEIPTPPKSEDYLDDLNGWKILGNDRVGDCNAVTWANMRRLVTAKLAEENYPTQEQVFQFYKTQNPGFDPNGDPYINGPGSNDDQGMEVQTGLEYLHKVGGPDGVKALAFARVDTTNTQLVDAAIAIFGGLWLGVMVLDKNEAEFGEGKPWTNAHGGKIVGGHAILAGGYTPEVKFITWGKETEFTFSFWNGEAQGHQLVEEAWVVVWPEHLGSESFMAGVDINELKASYEALTGRPLTL
jgi:hypothetical protein